MAKFASCLLVLLAALFVAEGVNIPAPPLWSPGKFRARAQIPSNITPNDPRCKKGDGMYGNPDDCSKYIVCVGGTSQERKCPEGMKFDSNAGCTFEEKADCGKSAPSGKSAAGVKCKEMYEIFQHPDDCHKYVTCIDFIPRVHTCPNKQWYQNNTGCVDGKKCPQSKQRAQGRKNQLTDVMEN